MNSKLYMFLIYIVLLLTAFISTIARGSEEKYGEMIRETAIEYGVDPELALSIAQVESNFNPEAVGLLKERGIFQLRPEYHPVVAGDTTHNTRVAMAYLASLKRICGPKYGSAFFVCYNTGPYRRLKEPKKASYYKKVNAIYLERKSSQSNVQVMPYVGQ